MSAVSSDPQPNSRFFQCGTCQQKYSRLDHLARHVRSHTREKPYICTVCSKSFSRTDLLKRHAAGHEDLPGDSKRKKRKRPPNAPGRVTQACNTCATLHLKCEEQKPCRRCQLKDIPCEAMELSNGTMGEPGDEAQLPQYSNGFNGNDEITSHGYDHQEQQEPTLHAPVHDMPPGPLAQAEQEQPLDMFDGFRSIYYPLSGQIAEHGSGALTPRSVMDFGLQTNLELDDADLRFLDTYNVHVPFNNQTPSDRASSGSVVGIGADAFRESVWRFIPVAPQPAPRLDKESFALSSNDHENTALGIDIDRRATPVSLPQASRDRLLAIFLSNCKPAVMTRLALSFPSLDLLDNLLHFYLTAPFSNASTWLHVPTLSHSNTQMPELLGGMIAAGAVLTPDSALQKLGFAFQEALRTYLPHVFEEDNSTIRELHVLQAFMLQIEIGLWSGNSRRIEIAESFQQPLLTMVRRAGKFRSSSYEAIVPQPEDEGSVLHSKWNAWIKQESYQRYYRRLLYGVSYSSWLWSLEFVSAKYFANTFIHRNNIWKLVFHLFQHDAQVSIALSNNPLISYAEMHLPLPSPHDLWLADTATKWKEIYLTKLKSGQSFNRRPTLIDCMKDMTVLSTLPQMADVEASHFAFLYGAWRLIWEYKQFNTIVGSNMRDGGLVMRSRYQDLFDLLHNFRISTDEPESANHGISTMIVELILMHLHVSLEDIQLLAGLEGQEDAMRVYPSLQNWINATASRQAVWHAGQVIRAAKSIHSHFLRDFAAIAVYHASLTFWAYGVILNTCESSSRDNMTSRPGPEMPELRNPVWLDEAESTSSQRFIALDHGVPGIRGLEGSQSSAYLENPGAVLGVVVDIVERNHEMRGGLGQQSTKPPLVENLVRLMHGLRNATHRAHI
ncbi:hypothetical protein FQN53_007966 [Emmonsiellopsis sp. PD_33]|nr:hypothetical protein FQN53_007966 [Emmonsiellopsis sp. PD_33]